MLFEQTTNREIILGIATKCDYADQLFTIISNEAALVLMRAMSVDVPIYTTIDRGKATSKMKNTDSKILLLKEKKNCESNFSMIQRLTGQRYFQDFYAEIAVIY